jgi:hypothetical protein
MKALGVQQQALVRRRAPSQWAANQSLGVEVANRQVVVGAGTTVRDGCSSLSTTRIAI